MSCFTPKRKTASGVEDVTLPISAIKNLQSELANLGHKTLDKIDYLNIASPEVALELHNMDATVYAKDDGIDFNTICEITTDVNDSEVTYSSLISTHIPLVAGKNVTLETNDAGTAVEINATTKMPIIRVGAVTDVEGTMRISTENPLIFTVEIIAGKLQPGDQVQICTRQLFTYDEGRRRKMRLRKEWETVITESDVNSRFIFVSVAESPTKKGQRLFKTGSASTGTKTLSPLYIRVRRPILSDDGIDRDGTFSNIETVWKRYNRETGKIYIK